MANFPRRYLPSQMPSRRLIHFVCWQEQAVALKLPMWVFFCNLFSLLWIIRRREYSKRLVFLWQYINGNVSFLLRQVQHYFRVILICRVYVLKMYTKFDLFVIQRPCWSCVFPRCVLRMKFVCLYHKSFKYAKTKIRTPECNPSLSGREGVSKYCGEDEKNAWGGQPYSLQVSLFVVDWAFNDRLHAALASLQDISRASVNRSYAPAVTSCGWFILVCIAALSHRNPFPPLGCPSPMYFNGWFNIKVSSEGRWRYLCLYTPNGLSNAPRSGSHQAEGEWLIAQWPKWINRWHSNLQYICVMYVFVPCFTDIILAMVYLSLMRLSSKKFWNDFLMYVVRRGEYLVNYSQET